MKNKLKQIFSLNNEISTSQINSEALELEKARERLQKFQKERDNDLKIHETNEEILRKSRHRLFKFHLQLSI